MGDGTTRASARKERSLTDRVAALERQLDELRLALRQEVRTERLVVVDVVGRDRIVATTNESSSQLQVLAPAGDSAANVTIGAITGEAYRSDGEPESTSYVTVYGGDEPGVSISADDDGGAELEVYRDVGRRRMRVPAWVLDGEGLKAAPMRLHREARP